MHDDKLMYIIYWKKTSDAPGKSPEKVTPVTANSKKMLKQITYIKGYEAAQGGCREESQTRKIGCLGKAVRNKPNHLQRAFLTKIQNRISKNGGKENTLPPRFFKILGQ